MPGSGQVGFVVNKATLEQVISEYFTDFLTLVITYHHPRLVQ
jgi:hypothetical protein